MERFVKSYATLRSVTFKATAVLGTNLMQVQQCHAKS